MGLMNAPAFPLLRQMHDQYQLSLPPQTYRPQMNNQAMPYASKKMPQTTRNRPQTPSEESEEDESEPTPSPKRHKKKHSRSKHKKKRHSSKDSSDSGSKDFNKKMRDMLKGNKEDYWAKQEEMDEIKEK
jgi:hypothetical protein